MHRADQISAETRGVSFQEEVEEIANGKHPDPFHILGPHWIEREGQPLVAIRAFRPGAAGLDILASGEVHHAARIHPDGLFEAILSGRVLGRETHHLIELASYRLRS